jgi:hypothetical protein
MTRHHWRQKVAATAVAAVIGGMTVSLAACSGSSSGSPSNGSPAPPLSGSTVAPDGSTVASDGSATPAETEPTVTEPEASTVPETLVTSETTTVPELPTVAPSSVSPSSDPADSTSTSSTIASPTGASTTAPDNSATVPDPLVSSLQLTDDAGIPIAEPAALTARQLFGAATSRDLAALQTLSSVGPIRTNMGSDALDDAPENIVAKWVLEPDTDLIAAIAALLRTTPSTNAKGQVVWPGLAVQPAEEWTEQDSADLIRLGFTPNQAASVVKKGRYLDRRLVIDADGTWYSYTIGP